MIGVFVVLAALSRAIPQAGDVTGASVSGRVVDAVSGVPIEGAIVSASSARADARSAARPREAVTDAQGQFTIQDLPAGAVIVQARNDGYVTAFFKTRDAAASAASISLTAGAHVRGVTIRLAPLGAICGTVSDSKGVAVAKQRVDALTMIANAGLVRFYSSASTVTDSTGAYCLDKLYPAHYVVLSVARPDATPARPAIFYPSTTSSALATVLDLDPGARLAGIDLAIPETPTHVIAGRVSRATPDMFATLSPLDRRILAPRLEEFTVPIKPDASFRFDHVPAGAFNLEVETFQPSGRRDIELFGQAAVTVNDQDVVNLEVTVAAGARVSGAVRFDGAAATTRPGVSVVLSSADGQSLSHGGAARLDANGRFVTPQLPPGDYLVIIRPVQGWSAASIAWRGADVSGTPLHLGAEDVDGVVVTMTDHPPAVDGVVRNDKGDFADADVLLFPKDPSQWSASDQGAMRFAGDRTDVDGRFHLAAMPGDYWLAAIAHNDTTDLWDRQTLARLTAGAQSLHLAIGALQRVDLRVR